jgi:hypothetical protein
MLLMVAEAYDGLDAAPPAPIDFVDEVKKGGIG